MAYCLDEAIWWFGNHVEGEVRKAGESTGKNDTDKRQKQRALNTFNRLMGKAPVFANTQPT